ncbi:hypothetical protein SAY87_029153 [Trapa incisa]|uniref:Uncharacterized protein n=1 Tax=Trapa incisa TaxID=236973 RepID=A0AAN7KZ44_9MYRT|nr:hypothetical protein SAY87_029153 [Trapa incisa]
MNMDIVSKVGKELYRSKTSSRRHQIIKKGKYHGFGSSRSGVVSGENLSSENNFSEDYIVFRIREDGAIDVVEDEQEVSSHLHQIGEYKKSIKGKDVVDKGDHSDDSFSFPE